MSTGLGRRKARAQPGVEASSRDSAPPELKPGPQPALEVFAPEAESRQGHQEARRERNEVYKEERSGTG